METKPSPEKITAPTAPTMKLTICTFGTETQKQDDGSPAIAWWLVPVGDDNGEPVAGGYCATEADCRSDARAWLAVRPEFSANF